MKYKKSICWAFSGLMLAASGAYAQNTANPDAGGEAKAPVKKSQVKKKKTVAKKSVKPNTPQMQQSAGPRTKAELEVHQRDEAEAKKQAEINARQRAEAEAKKKAENEAREKPLREADALMKAGKPAEAYALLEPMDFERSGEVRFDYLLGISALDSGKPDKATIAFERVLAVDPNFAGARLDMARAYYQMNDLPRAKAEFETVLKQNPPEAARATIQKYLDAMAAYERAKKTQLSMYVEGVVGHDGNVNTGTVSGTPISSLGSFGAAIATILPGITIPQSQRSSSYYGLAEGMDVSHTLNANWSIIGGADVRLHNNTSQPLSVYDSSSISGRIGVVYTKDQNAYKLTLTDGDSFSANTMRTDSLGMNGEWQHTFNASNQMNAFAQYGQNRAFGYQVTDPTKADVRIEGNTDQVVVGVGGMHLLADGKKALFGSVSSGSELSVAGRPDGNMRSENLRVGGQTNLTDKIDGVASLSWMHASYANHSALTSDFGNRKEDQYDLTLGASWHLNKVWTAKPQLAFSRKNSNVALYSYDRTDVSLTIRRDFK